MRNNQLSHLISMRMLVVVYWFIFWLMNGLDKFLNRHSLGIFDWWGKDRGEQFSNYFKNIDVSEAFIQPLLIITGIWELGIAALFIWALIKKQHLLKEATLALNWGFFFSGLTFIIFSFADVIFGDRAELREHGLFLAILWVSATVLNPSQKKS